VANEGGNIVRNRQVGEIDLQTLPREPSPPDVWQEACSLLP